MRRLILIAMAVLVASPALAAVNEGWVKCGDTVVFREDDAAGRLRVKDDEKLCMEYNNSLAAGSKTQNIQVPKGATVRACIEADTGGTTNLCTLDIDICIPNSEYSANDCDTVLAAPLNGAGGPASSQTRCVLLSEGQYIAVLVSSATPTSCEFTLESL